jgi:hypothetical protein
MVVRFKSTQGFHKSHKEVKAVLPPRKVKSQPRTGFQ